MNVYADNAATTKMSETAIKVMEEGLRNWYGNPNSLHSKGQEEAEILDKSREKVADVIGAANKNEIYFTSGGSEADNQALISVARIAAKKGKKHIISTPFEHHAILHTLDKLEKEGFEITKLNVNENGIINIDDLKKSVRHDTALVTIMFANNEVGSIQPVKEIGEICHTHGIIFHTDAVQAVGHLPINVQKMNIDMLSMSAHKFHGPKGIGALYCRNGIRLLNIIEGGSQERGKRAGTVNVPAIASMSAALNEASYNLKSNTEKVIRLRERLIAGLSSVEHSKLNGDKLKRLPGNVNFSFEGVEGESLLLMLDHYGIECSSGSACTSESLEPSHVLLAMGVPVEVAHGSLRFSIDEENTVEDIDYIIEKTKHVVKYFRQLSPLWDELEKGEVKHVI